MKIATTRFGEIDIQESELIVMKGPILGFQRYKHFVMLIPKQNTPLWWFQSTEDSALAFVVINPFIAKQEYNPEISMVDLEFLGIHNQEDIALLSIVTVRSQPFRVTANLRAPILINVSNRMAQQIVLDDPDYPIQFDIIESNATGAVALSERCRDRNTLGKGTLALGGSVI